MVSASYMVLSDLGRKKWQGTGYRERLWPVFLTTVYDFLRHAEPDMLDDRSI